MEIHKKLLACFEIRCQTIEIWLKSVNYLINKEAAQDATISVAQQNTEGGVVENAPEPFELVVTQHMTTSSNFRKITSIRTNKRILAGIQNCSFRMGAARPFLSTFREDTVFLHKKQVTTERKSFTWPKSKSGPKYSERLNGSKPANCSQLNWCITYSEGLSVGSQK